MRLHMRKYAAYMRLQIYANFCICGIIFTYVILKMPLYAEKYVICKFLAKYVIAYAITYSHITSIRSQFTSFHLH